MGIRVNADTRNETSMVMGLFMALRQNRGAAVTARIDPFPRPPSPSKLAVRQECVTYFSEPVERPFVVIEEKLDEQKDVGIKLW